MGNSRERLEGSRGGGPLLLGGCDLSTCDFFFFESWWVGWKIGNWLDLVFVYICILIVWFFEREGMSWMECDVLWIKEDVDSGTELDWIDIIGTEIGEEG